MITVKINNEAGFSDYTTRTGTVIEAVVAAVEKAVGAGLDPDNDAFTLRVLHLPDREPFTSGWTEDDALVVLGPC